MTRILVADDHEVVRSGLRAILKKQSGFEVVGEAENGLEAAQAALATMPDIIIPFWGAEGLLEGR
jgi:DNA-binding NarL/FixJ family response regulator